MVASGGRGLVRWRPGVMRWRPSGVLGSASPAWWWPASGGPGPIMIFFFFFVLFVVRLNSGAWQRMFDIISRGCRQLLSFVVHRPWRTTKILNRAFFRKVHGKGTLPCKKRSCVLCRVPR
jgi:hypothetical protein